MTKILITGGSGMVGRNVREHLSTNYHILTPTSKDLNLLESSATTAYLKEHRPNLIIHLAGVVGGIMDNIARPYDFLYLNTIMGLNLVNCAIESKTPRVLNISSSCVYPPLAPQPFGVDSILSGKVEPTNEGYALAKLIVQKACELSRKQQNHTDLKTLLPCNLYGPYDKFDSNRAHMIPAVIQRMDKAIMNNSKKIALWGNPETRREFMYVGDLAEAIESAIKSWEQLPITSNVGLQTDYSIKEYYEAVAKILKFKGSFDIDPDKPIGMKSKLIDSTAFMEATGWNAKTSLLDGISKTYKYYKDNAQQA